VKTCLDAIQDNIPPKTVCMISFMRWATSEMSLSPSGARKYRWPLWLDRGLWTVRSGSGLGSRRKPDGEFGAEWARFERPVRGSREARCWSSSRV